MKRTVTTLFLALVLAVSAFPQHKKAEGNCGEDVRWIFDGYTLSIINNSKNGYYVYIADYDLKNKRAPWKEKDLDIRKVVIGPGIKRIGSCAFSMLPNLQEVVFSSNDVEEIGWGAFMKDTSLRTISLPVKLKSIETIAFADCTSLPSIKVPDRCRVGDKVFLSCRNLKSVELSPNTVLGYLVFGNEDKIDNKVVHTLYQGEIKNLPSYVNVENCNEFGIARSTIEKINARNAGKVNYDYYTSHVDSIVPYGPGDRPNTYALVIGNQNYRFVADVPYAIHDARVFSEYCQKTLGIPASNIHLTEDATKQMLLEDELEDWLMTIPNREDKNLIVYYAGHGVPDVRNHNKAYLLPTDVRGTNAHRGIALDELYEKIGALKFDQCTVFLDACFSGVNRDSEGVTEGLRSVEIEAENAELGAGSIIVFSAANGNETAQSYPEEGHGLFTFYLLSALHNTLGEISLGRLSDFIGKNVSMKSMQLKMRKPQTPSTRASDKIGDNWRIKHL